MKMPRRNSSANLRLREHEEMEEAYTFAQIMEARHVPFTKMVAGRRAWTIESGSNLLS